MRQTILTAVFEVEPESADRLCDLIDALKQAQEEAVPAGAETYGLIKTRVPALHFMSMSVFRDAHYDPIFVIEANFDGAPGPFWAQLEAALEPQLREMLRCCKRPADATRTLYDEIVKLESRRPLAPYFEAKTVRPAAFHQGNRGLDRDRIQREADLFLATRVELRQSRYSGLAADQIHATLRAALAPRFPWLDSRTSPRIPTGERLADSFRLVAFLFIALFCLSIPGLIIAPMAPTGRFVLGVLIATLVAVGLLYRLREPLKDQGASMPSGGLVPSPKNKLSSLAHPLTLGVVLLLFVAAYMFAVSLVASPVIALITGLTLSDAFKACFRAVGLATLTLPFTAMMVLLWLRWLELRDSSHDDPPVNEALLREMAHREDRVVQNHMGSVVLVKPGILRAVLVRAGLWGLGLILRVIATDGYLGSMRTIHFAHWALVNNGSRLMFFSNFDGSWESYLDDFIEKAHGGLTLAWNNGVGFPPTRFLIFDGASHGRKFKAWARNSMAVSRFWFSAYKDYTVNQIERHARIADGLRRTTLSPEEAPAWARDL